MQSETSIQIDRAVGCARSRHGKRWTKVVISFFEIGNDNVQTIGSAALENRHKNFSFVLDLSGRARQPTRREADSSHGNCGRSKKITSCKHDFYLLWNSGELMTRVLSSDGVASLS